MKKDILVTGASGFIGTFLCRCLESKGLGYIPVGRRDFPHLKKHLLRHRPRVIFHLAGGRAADLFHMVTDNVCSSFELFEVIASMHPYRPRVVVIGSAAEYGPRPTHSSLIKEDSATGPSMLYGWVKLIESKAALYYAQMGQDVVVTRIFNIIGPGIPTGAAAGYFAKEIVSREKQRNPRAFSVADLGGARDFLDIRDIAEALLILSDKGKSGEIYNICSEHKVLMRDLLKMMIASSRNPSMSYKENKKIRPGVLYAVGSCGKFRRMTGWKPQYTLRQSIADTMEHYRKHL